MAELPASQHAYFIGARLINSRLMAHLIRRDPALYGALWAGCMSGGVTAMEWDPQLLAALNPTRVRAQLTERGELRSDGLSYIDLTMSRDPVVLGPFGVVERSGSQLIAMLARTAYGHALSGSVLHIFHVSGDEIRVGWFGAGGTGPISRYANNYVAINTALGTWSIMIRNMNLIAGNEMILESIRNLTIEGRQELIYRTILDTTPLPHLRTSERW